MTKNACERMGGEVRDNVCFVDKFPTHVNYKDWAGETIISDALEADKALVMHMTPDDAKKLFPPVSDPPLRYFKKSIETLKDRIKKGAPINPPWLEVCLNIEDRGYCRTWVVDHEGRHRIEAARLSGVSKIPVILREKPSQYCDWGKR